MPKEVEDKLKAEAVAKGYAPGSDRYNAYVYGTMRKKHWLLRKPGHHDKDKAS